MNKTDLIKCLTQDIGLPFRKAEKVVDKVFDTMSKSLVSGDRIEIRGFGSFTVRQYDGYTGRNPGTGEEKAVGPKKLPVFKVGQVLRDRLNKS
jgi:integration host factor subunit beta